MTAEIWTEPTWTIDQIRKLGKRIRSLARTNKLTSTIANALIIMLLLEIAIFFYVGFLPTFMGGTAPFVLPEWFFYVLIVTFMISMSIYLAAGSLRGRLGHLLEVYRKVGIIVETRCAKCNRLDERSWQQNDYVFKDVGTCSCGGSEYISQMYIVPLPLKKASLE